MKYPVSEQQWGRSSKTDICLAGDVGGTKVDLLLFRSSSGIRAPLVHERFPSDEYSNFESILEGFIHTLPGAYTISSAAFGVAGPVINGRAKITNLDWEIVESEIKRRFSISTVALVNDLVAISAAVPHLKSDETVCIHPGRPVHGGAMAVVAPGTGLGEAFLVWDGSLYRPYPSEGGHTDFAPMGDLQRGLNDYLRSLYGHVSYERVCSGMGLPDIFDFLRSAGHGECPERIVAQIESAEDRTPPIVEESLKESDACPLCREAMDIFVSVLGAEAGNLALKVLATGGVYLGGGLPPRILPYLKKGPFIRSFMNKGRFTPLLERIPVSVINHPNAALLGAGYCALGNLL